jgi:hypothetical protein
MTSARLDRSRTTLTAALLALTAGAVLIVPAPVSSQAKTIALDSPTGLRPHNVAVEAATLEGKKGVKVTVNATGDATQIEPLAIVEGLEFGNGVIEAEMAGAPAPGAGEGARGFVGVAFRLQKDMKTYDAFYLRPTNGRAEDQERRNHVTQYISHPEWTWFRMRKETPSRYESYADMTPNTWTPVKIEVTGAKARLFVGGQPQPALIVNDVKSGAQATGGVALWIGPGTVAHFRNLRVTPQ